MTTILKNKAGMNIVGQGGKIILFMLPSLLAAVWVQVNLPRLAALPGSLALIKPAGYGLFLLGLAFWGTAVVQLLSGFSQGKLVTGGAYGIARNPIYSSATFFILPAVALMTLTWVYLVVSVFLYAGVMIFIGKEERQLSQAFGAEYENYKARVARLVPFAGQQEAKRARKALLLCGILSSLLYVATDILAVMQWPEYSYTSQTVSELIAINAPTRPFVVPLFVAYSLLVYAFGAGVWRSAGRRRVLRLAALGLIGKEVLGLVVTLFFPIHLRGVEVTLTDTMHGVLTMAGNLFMLLAIGCGAAAFGKRFRIYSIMTGAALIVFGVLAGLAIPRLAANLPTPWIGVWERINIFAYMSWVVALAIALWRTEKGSGPIAGGAA